MATADLRGQQDRVRPTTQAGPGMVTTGGGIAEAACGLAVIALSIAGLAGVYPAVLAGIALIVLGAGLLCADGAVMGFVSRYSGPRGVTIARGQIGGGVGAEALAGLAGIVLGILALVGLVPLVLIAVSVIVFGAGVIVGGPSRARMALRTTTTLGWNEEEGQMMQEAFGAGIGARSLVGLATIVLGIIAVVMVTSTPDTSLILSLVGLLCLGSGIVLTGTALGGQGMMTMNR